MSSHEDSYEETDILPEVEEESDDSENPLADISRQAEVLAKDIYWFMESDEFNYMERDDRGDIYDAYSHVLKARDLL